MEALLPSTVEDGKLTEREAFLLEGIADGSLGHQVPALKTFRRQAADAWAAMAEENKLLIARVDALEATLEALRAALQPKV